MSKYYDPYKDHFWAWDSDENYAIRVHDQYTLIYEKPLNDDLAVLQDIGLPPLGSILHVLVAIDDRMTQGLFDLHLKWIQDKAQFLL